MKNAAVFITVAVIFLAGKAAGFGTRACARPSDMYLNGTIRGGAAYMPANLKIAMIGDNNRYVMDLILSEGAEMVIHAGDFDYNDDPDFFENQINEGLGEDFPFIASIGNHDVPSWDSSSDGSYHTHLYNRLVRTGMAEECVGDVGIDSVCSYKGLVILSSAIGTCSYSESSHVNYINEVFTTYGSHWKICNWHKNQRLYQTGSKSDETGYAVLDACRQHGAILHTAHEHSYSRTFEMTHFEDFVYDSSRFDPTLTAGGNGSSFVFVSGLGGQSIRGWSSDREKNPWWAATASGDGCTGYCRRDGGSSRDSEDGVLFCTFNVNGDYDKTECYFKDTSGFVFDDFAVTSAVGDAPTAAADVSCNSLFLEFPVLDPRADATTTAATTTATEEVLQAGEGAVAFFTIGDVRVSGNGKDIQGAWLQVFGAEERAAAGRLAVTIRGIHQGEPATTVVAWTEEPEDWERHTVWVADVTALLVEIFNKPSFVAGDAISFTMQTEGAPIRFYSLDHGTWYAPTLAVETRSPCRRNTNSLLVNQA